MNKRILTVLSLAIFVTALGLLVWLRFVPLKNNAAILEVDFIQIYLTGKALSAGVPIYEPLPDLATAFDPALNAESHPSPSAYPPAFAVLGSLISRLSYKNAFMLWGSFEIFCFILVLVLLIRHSREHAPQILITASFFVIWRPFFVDLLQGQMMMLATLLLTGAWLSLKKDHGIKAGLLLAILFSLKLYALPLFLLLIISKKWAACASAIAGFLVINLLTMLIVGPGAFLTYAQTVAPTIAKMYQAHPLNFSVFALFGPFVAALAFGAAFILALRSPEFDTQFWIVVVISSVLSPVAWLHYFLTFFPAVCLLVYRNNRRPLLLLPVALFGELISPDVYIYQTFGVRGFPLVFVFVVLLSLYFLTKERKSVATLQGVSVV
jgi:hypothetical protein